MVKDIEKSTDHPTHAMQLPAPHVRHRSGREKSVGAHRANDRLHDVERRLDYTATVPSVTLVEVLSRQDIVFFVIFFAILHQFERGLDEI